MLTMSDKRNIHIPIPLWNQIQVHAAAAEMPPGAWFEAMVREGIRVPKGKWRWDKSYWPAQYGLSHQLWIGPETRKTIEDGMEKSGQRLGFVAQLLYWSGLTVISWRVMAREGEGVAAIVRKLTSSLTS